MEKSIYVDILLLENAIMNFILLKITGILGLRQISNMKNVMVSILWSILTTLVFLFPMEHMDSFFIKLGVTAMVVFLTFRPKSLIELLKLTGLYFLLAFIFGGAAYGFLFMTNGVVSINRISLYGLIVSVVLSLITMKFLWTYLQKRTQNEKVIAQVKIVFQNKSVDLNALIDTGNHLTEPIMKKPVIIVEYECIKKLLNEDLCKLFKENTELTDVYTYMEKVKHYAKIFVIPYKTVGNSSFLLGIKIDSVFTKINNEKHHIPNAIIAICHNRLSGVEGYEGLINPDILKEEVL